MGDKRPPSPNYTAMLEQLSENKLKASCVVCREFPPEARAFITEALRRGYTYAEVGKVLEPSFGKCGSDIQRHRKNQHPN